MSCKKTSPYLIPALFNNNGFRSEARKPDTLQSCYTANPAHVSNVDSRRGGAPQMRRYKREGRRILAGDLSM